ncbi:MAG: hypothetical protein AUI14_01855 [Actinobacteria bacterium 13_2_20CM_2_71_6]|nr:MAG: hypothetical protein AUI14_01855 [Actinobacteria bacterium 13_2_20CM_2_71_6]
MTISTEEIRTTVEKYLAEYPDECDRVARLCEAVDDGSTPASRTEFRGHVTCAAVLVDPAFRVLHLHHSARMRWVLPGGHIDPTDDSLPGAALRELYEGAGLEPDTLAPLPGFEVTPIDIDVHRVPADLDKDEPDHWHFNIRHAFRVTGAPTIRVHPDGVSRADWLTLDAVPGFGLRLKLRAIAAFAQPERPPYQSAWSDLDTAG